MIKKAIVLLFTISLVYGFDPSIINNVPLDYYESLSNMFFKVGPEGHEDYPWIRLPMPDPMPTYCQLHLLPDEGPRPNARDISNKFSLRHDKNAKDPLNHTMFGLMFGQFINHDLENNAKEDEDEFTKYHLFSYFRDRNDFACLETSEPPLPHPFRCGDNDPVMSLKLKKSHGVFDEEGNFWTINRATPLLDLSQVYGYNRTLTNKLRSFIGGKLLMRYNLTRTVQPVLPPAPAYNFTFNNILPDYPTTGVPVNPAFPAAGDPDYYFTAGDDRVNENAALSLFHTIFAREHNRICDELMDKVTLFKLFPHIFDEVLFLMARAINIAQYQRIVYEEYLPNVLGPYFYEKLGPYTGYKKNVDPSTSLLFASAAFRYGHFQITSYQFINECGQAMKNNEVSADPNYTDFLLGFQNPSPAIFTPLGRIADAGGFENILRGLVHEVVAPNGMEMHNIARNLSSPGNFIDLSTTDIIRARYNQVPKIYGSPGCPANMKDKDHVSDPLPCFRKITSDLNMAKKLRDTFKKIKYIDAIVGMQLEDPVPGSIFGHTTGNILVDQFKRSRDGDKFFYKLWADDSVFNVTMKTILERNLDSDLKLPDNLFVSEFNYKEYLQSTCEE